MDLDYQPEAKPHDLRVFCSALDVSAREHRVLAFEQIFAVHFVLAVTVSSGGSLNYLPVDLSVVSKPLVQHKEKYQRGFYSC